MGVQSVTCNYMIPLLRLAAYYAKMGDPRRDYYVGCVIQRNDGAIVHSYNSRAEFQNPNIHAEAKALRKTDVGATLYVARVTHTNILAHAKPCPRCQSRIRNKGISKVIYTISPSEYGVWYPQKEKGI
jgi:tRNA(Arg) A34 adenosine deaminase TadA